LPGSWPKVKTVPDIRLSGGETIGSLEVVPTPGHSPGHVAFRDTCDGPKSLKEFALLLGDSSTVEYRFFG